MPLVFSWPEARIQQSPPWNPEYACVLNIPPIYSDDLIQSHAATRSRKKHGGIHSKNSGIRSASKPKRTHKKGKQKHHGNAQKQEDMFALLMDEVDIEENDSDLHKSLDQRQQQPHQQTKTQRAFRSPQQGPSNGHGHGHGHSLAHARREVGSQRDQKVSRREQLDIAALTGRSSSRSDADSPNGQVPRNNHLNNGTADNLNTASKSEEYNDLASDSNADTPAMAAEVNTGRI